MFLVDNKEKRRIPKDPALSPVVTTTATHHGAEAYSHPNANRCRRCRRPIWSVRSVSRRTGPVCFRRERVAA